MPSDAHHGKHARLPVRVECYAGYRDEETPRRFCLAGGWLEVVKVVDRWRDPAHRYFKVRADDADTYVLEHDTELHRWELVPYQRDRE
jgi:hypothetical protein